MNFNFSQLQQSVDRLLVNSSEAISKLVDLSIAPAKDITVQYYDQNGNLVTQTTPNMMKVLNTVQTNINSFIGRTVWVDQVNGNDNNDGTQARPFKTLQKAIDSTPYGGAIQIIIVGNYELDSHLIINKAKNVFITLNGKLSARWIDIGNNTYAITRIFLRDFSSLTFYSGLDLFEIYVPPPPQNLNWVSGVFIEGSDLHTNFLRIRPEDRVVKKIEINNNAFIGIPSSTLIFNMHFWSDNNDVLNNSYIKFNNGSLFFVKDSILIGRVSSRIKVFKDNNAITNNNFYDLINQGNQTNQFLITYNIV